MLEDELVISFPPFDEYGIKKKIDSKIKYIELKDAFLKVIESAKKSISISSPFLDIRGTSEIIDELLKKAYSGVKVRILVRETQEENSSRLKEVLALKSKIKDLDLQQFFQIKDYHYHKTERVYSSTHAKFIIADSKYAYVGSGELRKNSIEKNFEVGLLVKDQIPNSLEVIFEELWSVSEVINNGIDSN